MSVITLNIVHDASENLFLDFENSSTLLSVTNAIEQLIGVPLDMQQLNNLCARHPSIVPIQRTDLLNETLESLGVQNLTVVRLEQRRKSNDNENELDENNNNNNSSSSSTSENGNGIVPFESMMDQEDMQMNHLATNERMDLREILAKPSVLPYFRDGPFDEAFDASKRETRILMAIVYSNTESQSLQFITEVLTNESLMSLVEHHFILWCGNTNDPNAMQPLEFMIQRNPSLAQQLNFDVNPTTVLLSYIDNSISLIDVIYGHIDANEMATKLMMALEVYGPLLDNQRDGRTRTVVSDTQMLLSEQDQRYEEAMQRDRELMEEKKRKKEREEEAAQELERQKERTLDMLKDLNKKRSEMLQRIPQEPVEGTPETTVLKFRLCDGVTTQRCFQLSDTLDTLFMWLDCNHHQHIYMLTVPHDHQANPSETNANDLVDEALIQRQLNGQFDISSTYPRKTYRWNEHGTLTLKEANLKSAQLFVSEI